MSFTGIILLYTVYTWPKLGAAALASGRFLLWWQGSERTGLGRFLARRSLRRALGGWRMAAWHFRVLGLVPLVAIRLLRRRVSWLAWCAAAAAFALMSRPPWITYQRFYEPPGNRLLKWHLAGVIPPDERSFFGENPPVRANRQLGWAGAVRARVANLQMQWAGDWRDLARFGVLHPIPDPVGTDET